MHRLDSANYEGAAGELVRVTTQVQGGGRVIVSVDDRDIGDDRQFRLKANPGDKTRMRITLFGATDDRCVVTITQVDGGTDGDLLVCRPHDPAPAHFYSFTVVGAARVSAPGEARGQG